MKLGSAYGGALRTVGRGGSSSLGLSSPKLGPGHRCQSVTHPACTEPWCRQTALPQRRRESGKAGASKGARTVGGTSFEAGPAWLRIRAPREAWRGGEAVSPPPGRGPWAGRDSGPGARHTGGPGGDSLTPFLSGLTAPASLPSPDLHCGLRRPPVHKVLVGQRPVCRLVVPGPGHAEAGGQARPSPQALLHVEVHEGLLPRHGECWDCPTTPKLAQGTGSRILGWEWGPGLHHSVACGRVQILSGHGFPGLGSIRV